MRLHLAEEPETITPTHVAQAITDCAAINADGRQWATLDIIPTKHGVICRMSIGNILSGGFKEREIVTRDYFVDITDGKTKFVKHVHP